ncbi:helix-turn-helix domain-containing protein [Mycolicibacterium moriokaense]|uniref:Helix-turn-helix domain-containing protein n=1 Tax=Mycolicibacterium moriokaense TaxID=39691 RepID=A0AAD1HBP5_9MYCO|nr:helix-turn-helix domain-containing protein [Mycolicibacterium moriokaense]MCV7039688.1 helix-turn-helix domain-containing protein [Mycolicibacterium moriokaense]BBX01865.1 hypothetical protein MMOR_28010 [Mycolicibacterium moriokaense]
MATTDKFTPWKFRQSLRGMKLTGTQYRVAVELAEHAKIGKPAVWPSIATLARHCAVTTRAVEMALRDLTELGIIAKGKGNSTRILVIQPPNHSSDKIERATPPNHSSVTSEPQFGHTPNHSSDEYLKYENEGTNDAEEQSVVHLDCEIESSHQGCPKCHCLPEESHTDDCPNNPWTPVVKP